MSKTIALLAGAVVLAACKFPYPADVKDEDATSGTRSVGGAVSGLWTGGAITLHLAAGDVVEDVAASAAEPFTFAKRLDDGATYVVTVLDDGPDHDCTVTNGNGSVNGADVSDLAVSCTNLIPHSIAVSAPVVLAFDPRVTSYPLAVSVLQQEVVVSVMGATLTSVTVAGQPVQIGQPSAPVALGQGQTTVAIVASKGPLSRQYDLVFDRGGVAIAEARYARASNPSDEFGRAVALSSDYAAIGAPRDASSSELGNDSGSPSSGAVYLFRRTGVGWAESQFVKGSAIASSRALGADVAMDGDTLVIGAPGDSARGAGAGAVYVYRLDRAMGRWREEQRITAGDAHAGDQFGAAVAVSGDRIAVGAPSHDGASGNATADYGAIYFLRRNGTVWMDDGRLVSASPTPGDSFGNEFALDGDTLAVTVRSALRVYRRAGTTWSPEVVPADVRGRSPDLDGNTLVLGQPGDASGSGLPGDQGAPDSGAVLVFARSGIVWSQVAFLKAMPPQEAANIGASVAIRGNTIVTTSPTFGALQAFHKVGTAWFPDLPLYGSGPPTDTSFGIAVDVASTGAVVASPYDNGPGPVTSSSGTAWFFR